MRFLVENGCDVNEPGYENHELAPYARHYLANIDYLMSKGLKLNRFAPDHNFSAGTTQS